MSEESTPRAVDAVTNAVISKYGVRGIVVCAICAVAFAACVWGAAHLTAAPGTPISVLWGLVHYTKEGAARGIEVPQPAKGETPITQSTTPVPIRMIYPKPGQPLEAAIAALVKEYGLRDLEPLESGKTILEVPRSTKFFISGVYARYLTSPKTWDQITTANTAEGTSAYLSFLLQSGSFLMLVYCSESDASRLGSTGPNAPTTLTTSAVSWSQMRVLALIPSERIAKADYRVLNAGANTPFSVLDMRLN